MLPSEEIKKQFVLQKKAKVGIRTKIFQYLDYMTGASVNKVLAVTIWLLYSHFIYN